VTTATHPWLERVSAYHSGDLDDVERAAVAAHLRDCAQCQEALDMYRRFYSLARSPLRLGPPSPGFDERTTIISTPGSGRGASGGRLPGGPRRPPTIGLVAAALAAVIVVGGFVGLLGARGLIGPTHGATPTTNAAATATVAAAIATAAAASTQTAGPTPTPTAPPPAPTNAPFVCANPAGSALTYAFVNADRQIYTVTGCAAPVQLTHLQFPTGRGLPIPLAWSPSHRFLAYNPNLPNDQCVQVVTVSTGTTITTQHGCILDPSHPPSEVRTFVGWIDDASYLERIDVLTSNVPDPARLVRVDAASGAETIIKSYAWMSDVRVRAGYAFFGSRIKPDDTTAYLYRLSLADGSEARLVSLGLSGFGGCQVGFGPCSWTAPWDVSSDGTRILYHNPGADSLPSDTHVVPNTPVYYASLDGSGAVRMFTGAQSPGMTVPTFDPTGALTAEVVPSGANIGLAVEPAGGGTLRTVNLTSGQYVWRGDGRALILINFTFSGDTELSTVSLYDLGTGQSTPLAANTEQYLWAS
jgi:putative zinc finger protein